MEHAISSTLTQMLGVSAPLLNFFTNSTYARRQNEPGIADFAIGNPHEMPIPAFGQTLQAWATAQDERWYAYKMSEPEATRVVAASLNKRYDLPFRAQDICMTNGAFGALAVTTRALAGPGDEIIFVSPPWFFYEALIVTTGATPVRVKVDSQSFDLDIAAIAAAITPRTRAIIINSPNNPTGKIYPPETLQRLAETLTAASAQQGKPIYLLSDEAYSHIVYEGNTFHTPTAYYPYSFLIYTYGKTLLTPGQRLGYIALSPSMPQREQMAAVINTAQLATGWAFPNALLQHALADLETLSIDIAHLQTKRDRMVSELTAMGYTVHSPEGTFYLLPKAPIDDDLDFAEKLAAHDVLVLPGIFTEMPGYFRISLTASDAMIEHGLPGFAAAIKEVQ